MDWYAQQELEIEYNSAYDDHYERWHNERLDLEYEAWCDDMNAAYAEWPEDWPLYEMHDGN